MKWMLILIWVVLAASLEAQTAHKMLRQGDQAYQKEDYSIAEESYRKALESENSLKGSFNLGNSVYKQDRFEEAIQHFESTFDRAASDVERANALYNLGNAQMNGGQIDGAINSYKKAIEYNAEDRDILKNLFLAKLRKQEQQRQQQQQQQDEQQNEEEQNQDDQNQPQNQDQNEENQDQSSSEINNEGQQDENDPEKQELSMEDALKLLQVIENEEKNVQEKLRKVSGNKKKPAKDW